MTDNQTESEKHREETDYRPKQDKSNHLSILLFGVKKKKRKKEWERKGDVSFLTGFGRHFCMTNKWLDEGGMKGGSYRRGLKGQ